MYLGIPKEVMPAEHRVAAVPASVREYRRMGFDVLVQSGAGEGIYVSDAEYREAGAEVVDSAAEVYGRSQLVLKVKQPILDAATGVHEVELMKPGAVLVAFLHPAAPECHAMVRSLAARGITALTLDSVPRTLSYAQVMDALTSMSTVTGYRSVLLAATSFPRFVPTIGTAIGANPPARVLALGSGVVGLQAIATARRLGAAVSVVDIRPEAREQATSLGAKIVGFEVPDDLALGDGGYSRALPPEWLQREREALDPIVRDADIIIASALVPHERAPILITEAMVRGMRPGSVIIDVSVDQGGNCEVTEGGRTVQKYGVTICGTQNIPGGLAVDATRLFSQNMQHCVAHLFRDSRTAPDVDGEVGREMLVTADGRIVHEGTLRAMREIEDAAVPAGMG
jgi:H+-translocating NAD(P) transhydrogenase subunit alpha